MSNYDIWLNMYARHLCTKEQLYVCARRGILTDEEVELIIKTVDGE